MNQGETSHLLSDRRHPRHQDDSMSEITGDRTAMGSSGVWSIMTSSSSAMAGHPSHDDLPPPEPLPRDYLCLIPCSLRRLRSCVVVCLLLAAAIILIVGEALHRNEDYHAFPDNFVWGAATSAYQIEGAVSEGGRGVSIWDTYCTLNGTITDGSSGAVACDHYHRVEHDVKLMKELGLKAYRFSIAWPRIYPYGSGEVNLAGIDFYNHLIDTLLKHDIQPWATLYHWDHPQKLEDSYGGWMSPRMVNDFGQYARICFESFGDRVKHWITINEAWTVAVQGYGNGSKAPRRLDGDPTVDVYKAGHNLILAHSRASRIYKTEFAPRQHGQIGISNSGDFRYPLTASKEDMDAADRAMIFQFAWFADPFIFGDYPSEMRLAVKNRLPQFTDEQKKDLIGSTDFLGLNHYSTLYASVPNQKPTYGGYWADMNVRLSTNLSWHKNAMGWSTNPAGCRSLLLWLTERYWGVPIVMTENGSSEEEHDLDDALHDEQRREYFEGYLRACAEAIELGVPLTGYFAWSLMDNFEWEYGYTRRFGICYVDFETQKRMPKASGVWYSQTIKANGRNILRVQSPLTIPSHSN